MTEVHDKLLDGFAELIRSQHGRVAPEHDVAERERLVRALCAPARRRTSAAVNWPWLAAAATAAALVAVLVWTRVIAPDDAAGDALAFEVTGSALAEGGYLRAHATSVRITFSEGSELILEPGSVGRLAEVTDRGARLHLELGQVHARIAPRDGARWAIAAGPYAIAVTGTEFDVEWNSATQHLVVDLHEGSVQVRGPMVPDGVAMRAGQRLTASVLEGALELSGPEQSSSALPTRASTSPESSDAAGDEARQSQPSHRHEPTVPWSKRIADGEFEVILAEAEARGVEAVLASAPLSDVMAVADAARYKGQTGLARRALESVRARFGSSDAARTAAFLLGRMSETSPASAIAWYDRYLAESPGGTFASEAFGRKMVLLTRMGKNGEARALARSYLARHPKGAYAALARELAQ